MNFDIPDGLGDLLRDFTVAVIRQKPADIYEFAADWFGRVRDKKRTRNIPMYIIVDDEEEAGEPDPVSFKPKSQNGMARPQRRQSVSAERYNPEEDEGDDEGTVSYRFSRQAKGALTCACLARKSYVRSAMRRCVAANP